MFVSLAVAGLAGGYVHGSLHRNSPVFGRVLGRLPGPGRRVALTFDDGPNPVATPRILDVLRRENVPATFFLLGKHVERWPEIARDVASTHALGNHGWHHRKLHLKGPAYTRIDVLMGSQAIEDATGRSATFLRTPHGFRNPWINGIAREIGQRCVGWTLGVWDSDRPGADVIARKAIEGCRPGTILLLHDGDGYDPNGDRTQTADALPAIIHGLRERGFDFASLT